MNWNRFSAITRKEIVAFRRELFTDVFHATWREYEKTGDDKIVTTIFMQIAYDFPELKELFDTFYAQYEDKDLIWSSPKVIFGFLQRLLIVYEFIEFEDAKA